MEQRVDHPPEGPCPRVGRHRRCKDRDTRGKPRNGADPRVPADPSRCLHRRDAGREGQRAEAREQDRDQSRPDPERPERGIVVGMAPADRAVIAWTTASKPDMPTAREPSMDSIVRPVQTASMALVTATMRGRGLSDRSEESRRKHCIPPTDRKGSRISPSDRIPRPPGHWIIPRHSRVA